MCLYTKRILNRRYLPTKKNGYVPPICTDERLRYIDIECGECFECKKKKARQWRIRMSEEMRNNPSAIFFTGIVTIFITAFNTIKLIWSSIVRFFSGVWNGIK